MCPRHLTLTVNAFRALKDKILLFPLVWKRNIHVSTSAWQISILTLYTKQPEPQVLNILEPVYTQIINSKMFHYCTYNLYLFITPHPICVLSEQLFYKLQYVISTIINKTCEMRQCCETTLWADDATDQLCKILVRSQNLPLHHHQ